MFNVTEGFLVTYILQSIEDGSAVQILGQSFRDGAEDEFHIDFYSLDDSVIRREYNRRTTTTSFQEVTGENRERLLA